MPSQPLDSKSTFRCLAFSKAPGLYVAECIDLDIMTKAETAAEAIKKLEDAISGYLEVACEGDPRGLIPRPSPLLHRLRYYWFCLRAFLSMRRNDFRLWASPGYSPC